MIYQVARAGHYVRLRRLVVELHPAKKRCLWETKLQGMSGVDPDGQPLGSAVAAEYHMTDLETLVLDEQLCPESFLEFIPKYRNLAARAEPLQ